MSVYERRTILLKIKEISKNYGSVSGGRDSPQMVHEHQAVTKMMIFSGFEIQIIFVS